MVGQVAGHYQVHEKLGQGGMGEVYRARDTRLNRFVAIKALPPDRVADPERRARFIQEARAASALNHPNIITIHDIVTENGCDFIVMEYVAGETLAGKIAHKELRLPQTLKYAAQIADALACAHAAGIVHRDLKPSNIMIAEDGAVKVLDFGLAKLRGPMSAADQTTVTIARTGEGVVVGTAGYMSPEQVRGGEIDHRSDIFSLGLVLYEMLSGRRAFQGQLVIEVMHATLNETPPDLPDTVPSSLRQIVAGCLEKDPAVRFQSARDLAFALRAYSPGSGVSAALPDRGTAARPARRRWWLAAAFGGVLLGAVVTQSWFVWRGGAEAPLPPRRFVIAPSQLDNVWNTFGAAISPNGQRLVYCAGGEAWLRDLDQETPRLLEGSDGAFGICWSPDSASVAFVAHGQLRKLSLATGAATSLGPVIRPYWGATWSPDGRTIVYAVGEEGLLEIPAGGGEPRHVLKPGGEQEACYFSPSFLPQQAGARWVLLGAGAILNQRIIAANLETGEKRIIGVGTSPVYSPTGHILFFRAGAGPMTGVWAVPFNPRSLKTAGEAFPVAVGGAVPSVARDGTLLYQDVDGLQLQLAVFDRSGKRQSALGFPQTGLLRFSISPEGSRIAVSSFEQGLPSIRVQHLARATSISITSGPGAKLYPIWSLDGKYLIYSSNVRGSADLYIQAADGSGEPLRLTQAPENEHPSDWSRDGSYIIYQLFSSRAGGSDIWYLKRNPATGAWDAAPFMETPYAESFARISPNGRFLAYTSNESGQTEVYVRPFPRGAGKWQISSGGALFPHWTPDGNELIYVAGQTVMAAPVHYNSAEGGFAVGAARVLFTSSMPLDSLRLDALDLLPDGRIVMPERVAGATGGLLHVVQNWPAALLREPGTTPK